MAIKKTKAVAKSTNGGGRCPSCFFSCFGDSRASQPMVAVPSRRWRFWGKKKKTVPVNSAGDEAPLPTREVSAETPVKTSSAIFHWLHIKHQDKRIEGPISPTHNKYQLQHPLTHNYQLRPKLKPQMKPAATFHQIHEQIQSSHRSSLEPSHRSVSTKISRASLHKKPSSTITTTNGIGKFDSTFGLLVIAVALAMLLVCGRTVTILFICTLFFLARIRTISVANETRTGGSGKEGKDVDSMSSKEYKKMVVLKGLLERDPKRKTSNTERPEPRCHGRTFLPPNPDKEAALVEKKKPLSQQFNNRFVKHVNPKAGCYAKDCY